MSEHQFISHDEFEQSQREYTRELEKLEMRIESQLSDLKTRKPGEVITFPGMNAELQKRLTALEERQLDTEMFLAKLGRTVEVLASAVERMAGIE